MTRPQHHPQLETDRQPVDFDRYVSYDDDGATVLCDRRNAAAWIRSSAVVSCDR